MMSDQVFGDDFDDSDDFTSQRTTSSISGKKIAILVALLIVLALGAGAAVYFTGILDDITAPVAETTEPTQTQGQTQGTTSETPGPGEGGELAFLELPDMVVNLNSEGVRKSFLKLRVAMQLCSVDDEEYVKARIPRIMDGVQVYLRGLTPDGLRGSADLLQMRTNLQTRINTALEPGGICGVLFQEVLVQ